MKSLTLESKTFESGTPHFPMSKGELWRWVISPSLITPGP